MNMFDLISETLTDFELGEMDCRIGVEPKLDNKEYLEGYRQQYELEQRLTAQGEQNEPR